MSERSRRFVLAMMALSSGLIGCGGDSAATSTTVTPTPATAQPTPTPAASPGNATGFVDLGRVLSPTDFGRPSGTIIGDPTGLLLPDGRIRLFVYVEGSGVWRAISTDTEGAAFRVEGACALIPHTATNTMGTPWGEPRVVSIPGGLRMFYLQDLGIGSATSTDHVVWRQEPGLRITAAQAGARATTTGSVVPLAGGRYRMYFSELRHNPSDPATPMKSATSSDQLAWTMDAGVRVGPGAPHLDQNATDPFAMANADGSVTAWYFVQVASGSSFRGANGLYASTSNDGLEFKTSTLTGIPGGNPDVVVRADGVRMMYLSTSDGTGPGVRAVRLR